MKAAGSDHTIVCDRRMSLSPDVLSELIQRHWGPLMAWVGTQSSNVDGSNAESLMAEDVVQQAFIKLAGLDHVPENVVAWLYVVSRNEARNQQLSNGRRRRRHSRVASDESVSNESVWASAEAVELAETLSQLPDDLRRVVVARIWSDLTFDEIASLLNCSKATVWRRYETALTLLRKTYGVSCATKN